MCSRDEEPGRYPAGVELLSEPHLRRECLCQIREQERAQRIISYANANGEVGLLSRETSYVLRPGTLLAALLRRMWASFLVQGVVMACQF